MFLAYAVLGGAWGWLCWQNRDDLLPIQYYLSSLVGFLIIEMVASWGNCQIQSKHTRMLICSLRLLSLSQRTWEGYNSDCIPFRW